MCTDSAMRTHLLTSQNVPPWKIALDQKHVFFPSLLDVPEPKSMWYFSLKSACLLFLLAPRFLLAHYRELTFLYLAWSPTYDYVPCAKLLQSCPTLWNPMDCSPLESSIHGILRQEYCSGFAMPSCRGSSRPRNWTRLSHEQQHPRLPCPSLSPGVRSNSCALSWWWHWTIPSLIIPFSSCLEPSFLASWHFPLRRLLASEGQTTGASASVFPMNLQDWFLLSRYVPHIPQGEQVHLKWSRTICPPPAFCLWPTSAKA